MADFSCDSRKNEVLYFPGCIINSSDQEMIWVAQPAVEFARRDVKSKKGADANRTLTVTFTNVSICLLGMRRQVFNHVQIQGELI